MSIDAELDEINENLNQRLGFGLLAVFGLIGIYVYFIYGFAYLDITTLPYMLAYAGLCVLLFFLLKSFNILRLLGVTFLAAAVLMVSITKTNWQKQYYESDEPFMFQAHMQQYPSWEANLIAPFTGKKNWVGFAKECGIPAQEGRAFRQECSSYNGILDRYNLDMNAEIDEYLARMRHTAILVSKRGSLTGAQYTNCVHKGECAEIPFLPENVDPESIDPNDQQYFAITKAYWNLVDAKPLSPEVCSFMTLCKVLRTTGAITFE